jgi:preprotein translocase subunit YajC
MTAFAFALAPAQQAAPAAPGTDPSFFLMMGAIFAIFYFLVLRPQRKKERALQDAVKRAATGDRVVTAGGLHGKVVATAEDVLTVEIATLKGGQSVRVQVARARIESVTPRSAGAGESGESDARAEKSEKKKGGEA